ncbi:MAG: YbaB/EbfC family nucleoid-associated protein [Planctomycetota bacterium]|jgi:DNA-binding protein YbaB
MFGGLKSMAGMAGMLKDLPRLQAAAEEVRREIAALEIEGRGGGGAVVARVTGSLEVISIEIAEPIGHAFADGDQRTMASELVREAVNDALTRARAVAAERMEAAARDLGLPLPPGGIAGLTGGGGAAP